MRIHRQIFDLVPIQSLTGVEAVKYLLQKLDLKEETLEMRVELKTAYKQRREKIVKKIERCRSLQHLTINRYGGFGSITVNPRFWSMVQLGGVDSQPLT
jgi:hypothetical protein